ncbi:MAG: lyase family protein, partial [bacterium]
GSRAHVRMLAQQRIIGQDDANKLLQGLDTVEAEIKADRFPFKDELEDIHMNIEARLQEIVGDAGKRVHTARSRNDQVSLDLKLFCLDVASQWTGMIVGVIRDLTVRADEYKRD